MTSLDSKPVDRVMQTKGGYTYLGDGDDIYIERTQDRLTFGSTTGMVFVDDVRAQGDVVTLRVHAKDSLRGGVLTGTIYLNLTSDNEMYITDDYRNGVTPWAAFYWTGPGTVYTRTPAVRASP